MRKFKIGPFKGERKSFYWEEMRVLEGEARIVGGEASVVGGEASVVGGEASVLGGEASVVGGEASVVGGDVSLVGEASIVGGKASVVEGEASVVGGEACVVGGGASVVGGEASVEGGEASVVDGEASVREEASVVGEDATKVRGDKNPTESMQVKRNIFKRTVHLKEISGEGKRYSWNQEEKVKNSHALQSCEKFSPYEEDVVYGPEANLQEHYDNIVSRIPNMNSSSQSHYLGLSIFHLATIRSQCLNWSRR